MKKLFRILILIAIVGLLVFTFRVEIGEFVESKIGKENLEKVEDGTKKAVKKTGEVLKQGKEIVEEKLDSTKTEN